MKKRILLLTLLATSCAGGITSSDIEPSNSSSPSSDSSLSSSVTSSSSISSSEEYEYVVPNTLSALYYVVYNNMALEGSDTSKGSHVQEMISYYSNNLVKKEKVVENLIMYKDFSYTNGTKTITWENSQSNNENSEQNFTKFRGARGDYFYAITDYADGKSNDVASKYLIVENKDPDSDEILKENIDFNTSMFASYYFLTYMNEFLNKYGDEYLISYTQEGNDITYNLTILGNKTGDEYGSYSMDYTLNCTLDKDDGFLKRFEYTTEQKSIQDDEMMSSTSEVYEITRGARSEEIITYEDPENYWVKEYTVGFWYPDPDHMGERIYCDDVLPLGKMVFPYAKTYYPEKALDTDLYAVSVDDDKIIFLDSNNFYTNARGNAIVEVRSSSGVTQKVEVTVGNTEITSITLSLYYKNNLSRNIFPGDQLEILYKISPAGTLDDIALESLNTDIAKVSIVKGVPYLIAVKTGSTSIVAKSKTNENVSYTLDVTVEDNSITVASYLVNYKWYHLYGDLSFFFNEDGTGYYTLNGETYCEFKYVDKGNFTFEIASLKFWNDDKDYRAEGSLNKEKTYFSLSFYDEDDEEIYYCNLFRSEK